MGFKQASELGCLQEIIKLLERISKQNEQILEALRK